jgi:hypothetical protein
MLRISLGCVNTNDRDTATPEEMVFARLDAAKTDHTYTSRVITTLEYMGRIFSKKQMVYSRLDALRTDSSSISRFLFLGALAIRRLRVPRAVNSHNYIEKENQHRHPFRCEQMMFQP